MDKTFFKGAIILVIFSIIGKISGAVYRIPLAGIIGSYGMGQYQLVFPVYCLILTISTSGIPVAISKLVSEFNAVGHFEDSRKLLKVSIFILTFLSLCGAFIVVIFAKIFSSVQGNPETFICYYAIAPAILFVGVISAFRGYYQGNLNMIPTAVSNLIEQIVKLIFGLILAKYLIRFGTIYAVLGAIIAVSISEFISFLFLIIYYFFSKSRKHINGISNKKVGQLGRQLARVSLPITFGNLISPISVMIDSFIVVNLLMMSGNESGIATSLFGIHTGVVEPLINIPVVISIAISTSILPNISSLSAKGKMEDAFDLVGKSIEICLSISVAFFVCYEIFGRQILNILFGNSFNQEELMVATKILVFSGLNVILLSLVQVSSGILHGFGKTYFTVKSLIFGCTIRIISEIALVSVKNIGIYGVVISSGLCYLSIFLLNFIQIKKIVKSELKVMISKIFIQNFLVCVTAFASNIIFTNFFGENISLVISGILSVIVFFTIGFLIVKNENNLVISPEKSSV